MITLVTRHPSLVTTLAAFAAAAASAATPVVTSVSMSQSSYSRLVTIDYTFTGDPAVITLDVQTNANTSASADDPGWTSIGGEAVCNAEGDVWKKVNSGSRTITWRPDKSWPDHIIEANGARAVVTAWATNDTPAYMVVDISQGAQPNTQRFYPAADFVPGGVTSEIYKTTTFLMRKINAGGVTWTMGATLAAEGTSVDTHQVTLPDDYYIAVYETTQSQWLELKSGYTEAIPNFQVDRSIRPMEKVSYNEIRTSNGNTANSTYNWPNQPNPDSFLGILKTKTGVAFDLPSEAQWEFAARAGHGSGYWGDGSAIADLDNLQRLGRFAGNNPGGTSNNVSLAPEQGGTAKVGSYAPNDWGLYDMYGNVWEWCLDWYQDNATIATGTATFDGEPYGGRVNIDPTNPSTPLSGSVPDAGARVYRGGSYRHNSSTCRPSYRDWNYHYKTFDCVGFRVVCPVGIN